MQVSVHRISRYAVQVLTRRRGEIAQNLITIRLYDEDEVLRGTAVFENLGGADANKPVGDFDAQTGTVYFDTVFYRHYIDLLRHEKSVYLKMSWTAQGLAKALSHLSIDTKKEIIGEYFK